MDTKVSFALALAGVLIGVIFEKGMPSAFERITEVSKLEELSGGEIIAAILVALLYLSSFISILCFMLSIIARVKNLNNAPFDTEIPHSIRAVEATAEGKSIFAYDKSGKVAAAYEQFGKEVAEIGEKQRNQNRADRIR